MPDDDIRYDFGRNWNEYAAGLTEEKIASAVEGVSKLLPDLKGKSVIDIGCGSGIHALAALRLGASEVTCVDYDKNSVETTNQVLGNFSQNKNYSAFQDDILSSKSKINSEGRKYDIVYSWGVLHHTGDMWKAIDNATRLTRSGGEFALALYIRTRFCSFWKLEKAYYSKWRWLRPFIKFPFAFVLLLRHVATERKSPLRVLKEYRLQRGMSFIHDVDDWLGGYPYEAVDECELIEFMRERGFALTRSFNTKPSSGVFGAGCGEWTFTRSS